MSAKVVTTYFINKCLDNAEKQVWQRTTVQAKALLKQGYTVEQITNAIDYIVDVKKFKPYSFGYISKSIKDVLETLHRQTIAEEEKRKMDELHTNHQEVNSNGEIGERNRNKSERYGVQPRFGEKLDFNLFEGE